LQIKLLIKKRWPSTVPVKQMHAIIEKISLIN